MENKKPSNFTSTPYGSVLKKSECETIARNIMIILSRTGDKWRVLSWDEYKAERLQDLTEADAQNEGCPVATLSPHAWYANLWNSINGKTLPWSKNPWVWVYEFPFYQKEGN